MPPHLFFPAGWVERRDTYLHRNDVSYGQAHLPLLNSALFMKYPRKN
jgi:hypothetical protein